MMNPPKYIACVRFHRLNCVSVVLSVFIALSLGARAQTKSQPPSGKNTVSSPQVQIKATAVSGNSVSITVTIPGTPAKMLVHLNGHDVSSRFSPTSCDKATCEAALLTEADGLRSEKDVLTINAGHGVTGRLRFDTNTGPAPSISDLPQLRSMAITPGATLPAQTVGSSFQTALPPTVSFTTLEPGGWQQSANPWISINGTNYPDTTPPNNCSGDMYLAIVLDRQTLVEKIAAPESSPMCVTNSVALTTYLSSLTANDLVIVGNISGQSPDAGLDLTTIGGIVSGGTPGDGQYYPTQIFAVGSPGATPGTAYEGYFAAGTGHETIPEFGKGSLQEDAYGNYNFYSSDVIEYTVSPNDPGIVNSSATGQSAVSISIPNAAIGAVQQNVYTSPTGLTNGFWILVLSRNTMAPLGGAAPANLSPDGTTQYFTSAGTFFNTGSSDGPTAMQSLQGLADQLSILNAWQMAIVVSVGTPVFGGPNGSIWYVGGVNGSSTLPSTLPSNGFLEFSQAIQALGGTPNIIQSLFQPGSTYTFIGTPGLGGPLAGAGGVESSSAFAAQGQTGFVHGIMQRNLNGLYQPHQSNQEPVSVFGVKGGFKSPEFKLTETVLQQPVDWPSSSTTTVIGAACAPNCIYANSIAGQVAAYKLLSYVLLTDFYMQGLAPNSHSDDLHYFFTGSYNTSINYHTYDPQNFTSPTSSSSNTPYICTSVEPIVDQYHNGTNQCTITSFATDGSTLVFTDNDFVAVALQLHSEIQYLDNTLQFLNTGSNNLKSVIAAGSSNVGLALTGAAANVLGSDLVAPPPQTVVTTSWQSIVQLIAGSSSILSLVPGLEPLAPALNIVTKLAGGANSLIGGAMTISADGGAITKSKTSKSLPSAFVDFSDTISDLANGSLQDQLAGGFDTMSDSITSDWGRLSTIGPMTADPNNLVFFAPNQASQQIVIRGVSLAASRNFYLALMPAMGYSIDYYPGVQGWQNPPSGLGNIPDMGVQYDSSDWHRCSAFYLNPQTNNTTTFNGLGSPTPLSFVFYPTIAGSSNPFAKDQASNNGTTSVDMYVIGGKITYKGTDSTAIGLPSSDLTSYLFTSAGLNLPIDQFVTPSGPMQNAFGNMSEGNNRSGNSVGSICPAQSYPVAEVGATPPGGTATLTTTTLTAPVTAILGDNVPISATVLAGSSPVTAGSVYFTVDGAGSINSNLNTSGTATATIPGSSLTSGPHQISALYSRVDPYEASTASATTTIYTTAPDIGLSASANSVNVGYGMTSSPITLQLASLGGFQGATSLTCSGLPIGMTCNFNPPQVPLAANGQATALMTINGGSASASSFWIPGIGLLVLPLTLASLHRIRKGTRRLGGITCLFALLIVGSSWLSGCGGGSSQPRNTVQETGTKTVIISASSGTLSRTIPLQVTIQ